MQFIVRIDITVPSDVPRDSLAALMAAEDICAGELAAAGTLLRLWRVDGVWANIGLWQAPDEIGLREAIRSLPLSPYMRLTVTAVTAHPSDPGASSRA